jgi:hypothetical protein
MEPQREPNTHDQGTSERVPFDSPAPLESRPRSEVDSAYVGWVLPLTVFSIAIVLYAGISYGLYLLLGWPL